MAQSGNEVKEYPRGFSQRALNTLRAEMSDYGTRVVNDTSAFTSFTPLWPYRTFFLKQIDETYNPYGSAVYVHVDSTFPEIGLGAYNSIVPGYQYVLKDLYDRKPHFARNYGVIENDSTYSASNTAILNRLFQYAYSHPTDLFYRNKIYLQPGIIWIERASGQKYCLNIRAGFVLEGAGPSQQTQGTTLKVRASQLSNDTLNVIVNLQAGEYFSTGSITADSWWHGSGIRDLFIDCNGANQDTSNLARISGLNIFRSGEASFVENIEISDAIGWCFRSENQNAPPLKISGLTINPGQADTTVNYSKSAKKGVWIGNGGAINALSISGDGARPLLYVGSGGNGAMSAHISVHGMKFESGNHTSAFPVLMDSVNEIGSDLNIVGLTANRGSYPISKDVILIRGTTQKPGINVIGGQYTSFNNILKWQMTAGDDSIRNIDGSSAADQRAANISWGSGLRYLGGNQMKDFGEGFYYQDHLGNWVQTLVYKTDEKYHIISPRNIIAFDSYGGTEMATMHPGTGTAINNGLRIGGTDSEYDKIDSIKIVVDTVAVYSGGDAYYFLKSKIPDSLDSNSGIGDANISEPKDKGSLILYDKLGFGVEPDTTIQAIGFGLSDQNAWDFTPNRGTYKTGIRPYFSLPSEDSTTMYLQGLEMRMNIDKDERAIPNPFTEANAIVGGLFINGTKAATRNAAVFGGTILNNLDSTVYAFTKVIAGGQFHVTRWQPMTSGTYETAIWCRRSQISPGLVGTPLLPDYNYAGVFEGALGIIGSGEDSVSTTGASIVFRDSPTSTTDEISLVQSSGDFVIKNEDGDTLAIFAKEKKVSIGPGAAYPNATFELLASETGVPARFQNTNASGYTGVNYYNNSGTLVSSIVAPNASASVFPGTLWLGARGNQDIVFSAKSTNAERLRIDYEGSVGIGGGTQPDANPNRVLYFQEIPQAAKPTMAANTAGLFADTVSASAEMFVVDEADNVTQISPHDPITGEWIFYSRNTRTGKVMKVDMEGLVKEVEKLSGKKFMKEWVE